ncbi:MAG: EAL domain-containing protein [Nitrospira sp.]|nr:EAL domain-containing protein [Nitrospira sp.]
MREIFAKDQHIVLVVDDDAAMRLLMREAMEQAGFDVKEAVNGREAVDVFSNIRPDIILMDVTMPEMDGFEALQKIRSLPAGEQVPILMVTGLDDYQSINKAYKYGATDFVVKPINWLILSYRVRYILRANKAIDDLSVSEEKLAQAQKIANFGNWDWDLSTNKLHFSDELYRIYNIEKGGFGGMFEDFMKLVNPDDREAVKIAYDDALQHKKQFSIEHRILMPEGEERILRQEGAVYVDSRNLVIRAAGTTQDITKSKQAEDKIKFLAYYDRLTGLPNRFLFKERLQKAISNAKRNKWNLSVIFINIDNFKSINDTFGHETGDKLLAEIAEKLKRCLRNSEEEASHRICDTVARFGADEFAIILEELSDLADAAVAARRIMEIVAEMIMCDDREFFLGSRVSLSVYPEDGETEDVLIRNAAAAMTRAKEQEPNTYHFFTTDLNTKAFARFALEASMRKALERSEFLLYYQPQINLETGKVAGMEALLRWQHPEMGIVSPVDFIPLAEDTGLIVPIGEWVIHEACRQISVWKHQGLPIQRVAVNLSALQFKHSGLIELIESALHKNTLNNEMLELEITESLLMENVEKGMQIIDRIHEMGIKLSIDDFGTGYSSLNYLKKFPINYLKIDRTFVRDVTESSDDAAIVTAIITMAHSLKLQVVAEGVETISQLEFLKENNCDLIQGFYISRPLPAIKMIDFLRNWRLEDHERQ